MQENKSPTKTIFKSKLQTSGEYTMGLTEKCNELYKEAVLVGNIILNFSNAYSICVIME